MITQLPDLRLLQAEVAAQDAQGASEVKELALINAAAFMRYVAPFVPVHLYAEFVRTVNDIEFARGVAA